MGGILIDEVLPIQYCDRNSLCAESVKLGNKKKKKKQKKKRLICVGKRGKGKM